MLVIFLDVADESVDSHALSLLGDLVGAAYLVDLLSEVISVRDWGGVSSQLGEDGTEPHGHLFDERVGAQQHLLLLGPLLDLLLVLLEAGGGLLVDLGDLHLLAHGDMRCVSNDADGH